MFKSKRINKETNDKFKIVCFKKIKSCEKKGEKLKRRKERKNFMKENQKKLK